MLTLSQETIVAYEARMMRAGVAETERPEYLKWIRFYLDFCQNYGHSAREKASRGLFLEKLTSKGQSEAKRWQAAQAVELLLRRGTGSTVPNNTRPPNGPSNRLRPTLTTVDEAGSGAGPALRVAAKTRMPSPGSQSADGNGMVKATSGNVIPTAGSDGQTALVGVVREGAADTVTRQGKRPVRGASWLGEYAALHGAIKLRNYSNKTHEVYRMWVRRFQDFIGSKSPKELVTEDVKRFLTSLAVREEVAGSTQNQAFNALLFFSRHVLQREFGRLEGVVRAKRKRYVPVVLSREEVEAVLAAMEPPFHLVALLLYGCGMRLTECLELRIHCFNLDARLLTVHDGKGQKDRSVPLPERILPEIREKIKQVRRIWKADLESGFGGTFLPGQLGRKFKNAAREFRWQWFFPAATLTAMGGSEEKRRYHLHDNQVQAAIKRAADEAGVAKRVSPHTLRHTFASHLLMAGYDLPTIQRLLGHGDVKTTMIYVQTVPTITQKAVKSPLDFEDGKGCI